jgi:hypothetical protein
MPLQFEPQAIQGSGNVLAKDGLAAMTKFIDVVVDSGGDGKLLLSFLPRMLRGEAADGEGERKPGKQGVYEHIVAVRNQQFDAVANSWCMRPLERG